MKESHLNTIIKNSLDWGFKIPDNPLGSIPLCFDGFGVFRNKPVYWESKSLNKPQSFNFKYLKQHQIDNLLWLQSNIVISVSLFLIGVNYGRSQKRVYVFRDMDYIRRRKEANNNILKKEFDKRKNFLLIKNQLIDIGHILSMPLEWEYETL